MTHPCQPRKALKDSYSKHASAWLIIKMGRAEQKMMVDIAQTQVSYWPDGPLAKWIQRERKQR